MQVEIFHARKDKRLILYTAHYITCIGINVEMTMYLPEIPEVNKKAEENIARTYI